MSEIGLQDRLGDRLVAARLITRQELADALARRSREGGFLGHHLLLMGALSRRDLFRVLAEQWSVETRDLIAEPPDPALARTMDLDELATLGWVPVVQVEHYHIDPGQILAADPSGGNPQTGDKSSWSLQSRSIQTHKRLDFDDKPKD